MCTVYGGLQEKQQFLFIVFGTSKHNIEVGGYGGNVCIYTDGQSLRTFLFFQNFHSAHLEPSKNLHTKNLLASKVLTVRPFRCTRFLLWEPRQPTVRYALTIFFSQHNLLSFQFSRSVSAMLASSNRHWLKTKCSVWDWTFWKKSTSTRMSQRKFNTRRHT